MTDLKLHQPRPLPRPLVALLRPFQRFFRTESAGGVMLLAATAAAILWANSRWGESYHHLFGQQLGVSGFGRTFVLPLHAWINDALMALFFFMVGMEIKRELVLGELSSPRKAILPALAAIGGMAAPALIFVALNAGGEGLRGWGVPVATDIAFALGALAVLKHRVPSSLAVFLTALAIFDDLGAILVIALFYGQGVHAGPLLAAGLITLLLAALNLFGVRRSWPYLALGLLLWAAVFASGIHATIAGVVLGMCIPARTRRDPADLTLLRGQLQAIDELPSEGNGREDALNAVEAYLEDSLAPLDRLVRALHPWVAFLIVPVFALANAGIDVRGLGLRQLGSSVTVGVGLGLFAGKQVGIFAATWLAVKLRLSPAPTGASWSQVYGVAILGGIGFTMSLFVDALAFPDAPLLNDQAKLGILLGSFASAVAGMLFLRFGARAVRPPAA